MNRIDALFQSAQSNSKTVFVPFLTAGDPDLSTTMRVAELLAETTRDMNVPMLLELGFPYSDPLADGPTIQASYNRALDGGLKVSAIMEAVRAARSTLDIPIVAMLSYAIIHRVGQDRFLDTARSAGFDGVIIPDLPVEESTAVHDWGVQHDFKTIQLIAPTTRPERLPAIAGASTGFVYYVSVTGITGERRTLPADLVDRVRTLRQHASVPVCVGFGVSAADQVKELAQLADGVIVGSALVRRVGELSPGGDLESIRTFVRELLAPIAS